MNVRVVEVELEPGTGAVVRLPGAELVVIGVGVVPLLLVLLATIVGKIVGMVIGIVRVGNNDDTTDPTTVSTLPSAVETTPPTALLIPVP